MRRVELTVVLLAGFAAALALAALAGSRVAPSEELLDLRRSTLLAGPNGARGFAEALEALGVPVERRRRAFYGLAADTVAVDPSAWLAVLSLDPQPVMPARGPGGMFGSRAPSVEELRELMRYVERGGALFLAGRTGIEGCLGVRVTRVARGDGGVLQTAPSVRPDALLAARYVFAPLDPQESEDSTGFREDASCDPPEPVSDATLLETAEGAPVMRRLAFRNGGRVLLIADSRYLANQLLKETDAGLLALPWLLSERPSRVTFDEYHHGFGRRRSILLAAWGWLRSAPAGWVILQLGLAGLVAVAVGAARFGPALRVVERRRRSPLEHLDALAVGLERAEGRDAAVELIAAGLRRRLRRAGMFRRPPREDYAQWLGALGLAARTGDARAAVKRLGWLLRERGGDERVLKTATAVEDVWEALRPANDSKLS